MVRGARVWAFGAVAVAWVVGVAGLGLLGTAWHPGRIVATTLGMLAALGAGEFVRNRPLVQEERRREAELRRISAAEQERVRIARELHDVLGHSLSQSRHCATKGH